MPTMELFRGLLQATTRKHRMYWVVMLSAYYVWSKQGLREVERRGRDVKYYIKLHNSQHHSISIKLTCMTILSVVDFSPMSISSQHLPTFCRNDTDSHIRNKSNMHRGSISFSHPHRNGMWKRASKQARLYTHSCRTDQQSSSDLALMEIEYLNFSCS